MNIASLHWTPPDLPLLSLGNLVLLRTCQQHHRREYRNIQSGLLVLVWMRFWGTSDPIKFW